jgi:hypothetical protein
MLASSADVLEALACVLEVQADGREDQNWPRNRQNQLDDDLDGPEQQTVDQSVKNPAEQAEKKASAIRADEAPELARKSIIRPDFADGGGKRKFFLRCGDTPFSGKFPRAKLQSPRPQEISLALGRPSGIFIGVTSA